jgi:hypothetical protein
MQIVQNQISTHREQPVAHEEQKIIKPRVDHDEYASANPVFNYVNPVMTASSTQQGFVRKNASVRRSSVSPYDRADKLPPTKRKGSNLTNSKSTARLQRPSFGPQSMNELYDKATFHSKTPNGQQSVNNEIKFTVFPKAL